MNPHTTQRTSWCLPRVAVSIVLTLLLEGCGGDQPYDDAVGLPGQKGVPAPPSSLSLLAPTILPDFYNTPTIRVGGVKSGDVVGLFTDASCSSPVGSGTAVGATIDITSSALTAGRYTFYANVTQAETSECSTASLSYVSTACPIGFVPVPGDATLGTNDFCVMQFEAKAWNDLNSNQIIDAGEVEADGCFPIYEDRNCAAGVDTVSRKAVSVADNLPWRILTQRQARAACADLNGMGESKYSLISNPEWMTIARNIENQKANWSGGELGAGAIFQGSIRDNSASSYRYDSRGQPDSGTGRNVKARHILSNGEQIWDLSGNVAEWVDWNIIPSQKAYSSTDGVSVAAWREFSALDNLISLSNPMFPNSWQPIHASYNSSQGVGQYYAGTNIYGGAAYRGGSTFNDMDEAGIFSLRLDLTEKTRSNAIGFRCVYQL